jgi:hypothetical protein
MSISSLGRRLTLALAATATGAQFKTITATVFLRPQAQYTSEVVSLSDSVQLWSSGLVVTLGVTAVTAGHPLEVLAPLDRGLPARLPLPRRRRDPASPA